MTSPRTLRFPRMTALAAGLAMAFLGPDISVAVPPPVNNCNDSGPGSLREAAIGAGDGDTIDLMGLSCGRITLASGSIPVANNLTINGPGSTALEINGGQAGRIFGHTGIGTLSISGVTLTLGLVIETSGDAKGGCIASLGNVHLTDSVVTGCSAVANTGADDAFGGGVYAAGEVSLVRSTISGNVTLAVTQGKHSYGGGVFAGNGFSADFSTLNNNQSNPTDSNFAVGGGVYIAKGTATINNSTISGNQAGYGGGLYSQTAVSAVTISNSTISGNQAIRNGGGLVIRSDTTISNSTISGNRANFAGGGLYISSASNVNISNSNISGNQSLRLGGGLYIAASVSTATISNSTISDNQAGNRGGGFLSFGGTGTLATINNSTISGNRADFAGGVFSNGDLIVSNSTIAFNTADQAQNSNQLTAAGMDIGNATLTLNSTIIANNRAAGEASDLSNRGSNGAMRTSAFAGSKNLIFARDKLDLKAPMDTLSACPRLQRLAPHGGPTQTVGLRSGSFAIDFGIVLNALTTDQRGLPRVVNNRPDIGAYERQANEQDDALFFSSFESGCDE